MKYRHTSIWHYIYWLIPCSMWLTFTSCSIFRAISAFLPRFTFSPVRSNNSLPYEISKNRLENCKWPWSREIYRGFLYRNRYMISSDRCRKVNSSHHQYLEVFLEWRISSNSVSSRCVHDFAWNWLHPYKIHFLNYMSFFYLGILYAVYNLSIDFVAFFLKVCVASLNEYD